jgi:hypothetical protein
MATLEVRFAPSQRRLAFCRGGWKRRQINSIEFLRQRAVTMPSTNCVVILVPALLLGVETCKLFADQRSDSAGPNGMGTLGPKRLPGLLEQ